MKNIILLAGLVVLATLNIRTYGQSAEEIKSYSDLPTVFPNSPEASQLIKSVLYPVNYSTGLPEIEIPLYEIQLKDGTVLPIKLSYHASGFKVSEAENRFGIGWNLVAEPQISRVVEGQPDEAFYMKQAKIQTNQENLVHAAYNGEADFRPDRFFYRLIGKSGSFYSNRSGTDWGTKGYVTIPYDKILIEGTPGTTFSITDDNGYVYSFEHKDIFTPDANINQLTGVPMYDYATMYKGTKIKSPLNEVITFDYGSSEYTTEKRLFTEQRTISYVKEHGMVNIDPALEYTFGYTTGIEPLKYTYNQIRSQLTDQGARIRVIDDLYSEESRCATRNIYFVTKSGDLARTSNNEVTDAMGVTISRETYKRLVKINFPGGEIKLNEDKFINKIEIKNHNNEIIKIIKFFMHELPGESPRHLLDSIQFCNPKGQKEYSYNFSYYNAEQYLKKKLPAIDCKTDVWGNHVPGSSIVYGTTPFVIEGKNFSQNFHAGGDYYEKFRPSGTGNNWPYYVFDADEIEGWNQDRANERIDLALKEITYPTGGTCKFTYEPNYFVKEETRYETVNGKTVPCPYPVIYYTGGLRIKKMENFDKGILVDFRRYKYGSDKYGGGVALMELSDDDFVVSELVNHDIIKYISDYEPCRLIEVVKEYKMTYSSKPIRNPYFEMGTPVVYDMVTEYYESVAEGSSKYKGGKTIYTFDVSEIEKVKPFRMNFENTFFANSSPVYSKFVVNMGNEWRIGQPLSIIKYNSVGSPVYSKKYKYEIIESIGTVNGKYVYPRYSKEIVDLTRNNPCLINSQWVPWPRRISRKISGSGFCNTSPLNESCTPESLTYRDYIIAQGIKLLSEEEESIDGVTTKKKFEYSHINNSKELYHLNPYKITVSGAADYIDRYTYTGSEEDELKKRNILNKLIARTRTQSSQTTARVVYNYGFSNNGTIVTSTTIPSSAIPVVQNIRTGTSTLEERIVYKNYDSYGNPAYVVKDGATHVVYIWGYKGQYPVAKIENATYDEVKTALGGSSFITNLSQRGEPTTSEWNTLRTMYTNSTLKNASVTIYNYKPLVGVVQTIDPRQVSTYYDYDSHGRLNQVYYNDNNNSGSSNKRIVEDYIYNYRK